MKKIIKTRNTGITISEELVKLIKSEAEEKEISLNELLNNLIEDCLISKDCLKSLRLNVQNKTKKVRVSILLKERTAKQINNIVFDKRITKSSLIESIIEKYLDTCVF